MASLLAAAAPMTLLMTGNIALGLLCLVFLWRVVRLGKRKKCVLQETLLGEIGEAEVSLVPEGVVTVRCRSYPARATAPIGAGDRVCVIGTGEILTVERHWI